MGYEMLLVLASFHYILFHNTFIQKKPLVAQTQLHMDHFGSVCSIFKKQKYYFSCFKEIKMLTREMQTMSLSPP